MNSPRVDHADRPATFCAVLTDLNSADYSLLAEIEIVVEEYPDEVVARWPEVEVYANGVTESEALSGLKRQITELFDELETAKPATLGRLPLSWRRILKSTIQRNAKKPQGR